MHRVIGTSLTFFRSRGCAEFVDVKSLFQLSTIATIPMFLFFFFLTYSPPRSRVCMSYPPGNFILHLGAWQDLEYGVSLSEDLL